MQVASGNLMHLLEANGQAAVEKALPNLPLRECTVLIGKALDYQQVGLA